MSWTFHHNNLQESISSDFNFFSFTRTTIIFTVSKASNSSTLSLLLAKITKVLIPLSNDRYSNLLTNANRVQTRMFQCRYPSPYQCNQVNCTGTSKLEVKLLVWRRIRTTCSNWESFFVDLWSRASIIGLYH